jgi:hypothetical protein
MILETSRYAQVPTVAATDRAGRPVTALKLRRLPATAGSPYVTRDNDRLDLLAQSQYGDGTRFWHIADANTALDARDLTGESVAEQNRRERDTVPPTLNLPQT